MMTVIADVNVTRRQRMHHVFNEAEEVRFSASKFGDVLEWLHENGEFQFEVRSETMRWYVQIGSAPL